VADHRVYCGDYVFFELPMAHCRSARSFAHEGWVMIFVGRVGVCGARVVRRGGGGDKRTERVERRAGSAFAKGAPQASEEESVEHVPPCQASHDTLRAFSFCAARL
jgi:hypothetical protein